MPNGSSRRPMVNMVNRRLARAPASGAGKPAPVGSAYGNMVRTASCGRLQLQRPVRGRWCRCMQVYLAPVPHPDPVPVPVSPSPYPVPVPVPVSRPISSHHRRPACGGGCRPGTGRVALVEAFRADAVADRSTGTDTDARIALGACSSPFHAPPRPAKWNLHVSRLSSACRSSAASAPTCCSSSSIKPRRSWSRRAATSSVRPSRVFVQVGCVAVLKLWDGREPPDEESRAGGLLRGDGIDGSVSAQRQRARAGSLQCPRAARRHFSMGSTKRTWSSSRLSR